MGLVEEQDVGFVLYESCPGLAFREVRVSRTLAWLAAISAGYDYVGFESAPIVKLSNSKYARQPRFSWRAAPWVECALRLRSLAQFLGLLVLGLWKVEGCSRSRT